MKPLLRLLWALTLAPLLGLLLAGQAQAQLKPVPEYTARVTDQASMLAPEQRQNLERVLADYETQTGSQIAVLLVKSTEPEAIEQYSIRVAEAWKLGRKGVDDGVLLLVARDNPSSLRRLRIEAGRGVQGVLTDAQSKRILQDTIAPHFRQNDYYGGLVAGVGAISALLNQEKFPAPQAQPGQGQVQGQAQDDDGGPGIVMSIFFIVIGLTVLRSIFSPRRSRLSQPGIGRRFDNGWNSGATGFILGSILSNMNNGRNRGGGFSGGGGFTDGGGFSGGGGGSFDGGGASGDW
jgi:uncharacterized protein